MLEATGVSELKNSAPFDSERSSAPSSDGVEYGLNHAMLSIDEQKVTKKLKALLRQEITFSRLLNLDTKELQGRKGFTAPSLATLRTLAERVRLEAHAASQMGGDDVMAFQLRVPMEPRLVDPSVIDTVLVEDVARFLGLLDDAMRRIAVERWGFGTAQRTLNEIGEDLSFTRERVRQLEKEIGELLPLSIRIHPTVLWANIEAKLSIDLSSVLPQLSRHFQRPELFCRFIENCCRLEEGAIQDRQGLGDAESQLKLLDALISSTASPISYDQCLDELINEVGMTPDRARHYLEHLEELGRVAREGMIIKPFRLTKKVALAHVLAAHPGGLPWKDVARVVNKLNISECKFSETKMGSHFPECEYVNLYGQGVYRHIKFLNVTEVEQQSIIASVREYLSAHEPHRANLQEVYGESASLRTAVDYYTLRHLIASFGEEYGVYFDGRSQCDTVSLAPDPDGDLVTTKDIILNFLTASPIARTQLEIAQRLRSKSLPLVSLNIVKLRDEGKVVQVDHMRYTTTDKAFLAVDKVAVATLIKEVLTRSCGMLESHVVFEEINERLHLCYSNSFYRALSQTLSADQRWELIETPSRFRWKTDEAP